MNPPTQDDADAIGELVFAETKPTSEAESIVWDDGADSDINTSLFKPLGEKNEVSLATRRLQGCTVLAIISRKGVYFGHYWESISFHPDAKQLKHVDENNEEWWETPEEIFVRTVINGLRRGMSKQQTSLTSVAPAIADDHIKAYLIRPKWSKAKEDENDEYKNKPPPANPLPDGYPDKWQRMKDEAVRLIPKLNEPDRWKEVLYEATDKDDILDGTPRGRMLFKYDPVSQQTTRRGHKPTRMSMLWSETTEVHRDTWQ